MNGMLDVTNWNHEDFFLKKKLETQKSLVWMANLSYEDGGFMHFEKLIQCDTTGGQNTTFYFFFFFLRSLLFAIIIISNVV